MKNIKNYTSSVPSDKSILQIERILIDMGARNIAKEYDGFGKVDKNFSFNRSEDQRKPNRKLLQRKPIALPGRTSKNGLNSRPQ
jgi:hypothetical protein